MGKINLMDTEAINQVMARLLYLLLVPSSTNFKHHIDKVPNKSRRYSGSLVLHFILMHDFGLFTMMSLFASEHDTCVIK